MKAIRLFAVLAIVALPALADLSAKYKEWGSSPQAYFMTKAEREQWSAVKTDADAEQFIKDFLAKRGPDFPALVNERIAAADKYLSYGKTPGSQTMRGKVIVVLGPPSSFGVTERTNSRAGDSTVSGSVAAGGADGRAGGMPSLSDMQKSAALGQMGANVVRDYDIGYTADKLAYGKALNVTVELDITRNTERITSRKVENDLQDAMQSAAAASIKTK